MLMLKHGLATTVACACLMASPVVTAESPSMASPALSGWVRQALTANPQLQAAEATIQAAEGRYRAADQALFNPELEVDFERTDLSTGSAGISQTLDWSNKRESRTEVADHERQIAAESFRQEKQRLTADLLKALADWNTARTIAQVSDQQRALMNRFVNLAERRRQAGDLGQIDLDLAHLAASEAGFQKSRADEEMIRSDQAVLALTGQMPIQRPPFDHSLPDIEVGQDTIEPLLDNLPAIRMAQAKIAAARAGVKLRTREKRADPTVGFRLGKEGSESLGGLTFSIPLFVRNRFQAEVDVANANVIQASRAAINLRRQTSAQLMAAARIYQNARQSWLNWEASGATRLSQRTELLDRLWQAGELRTTDYLVQLKQALETEISAIEQQGRLWQAWSEWLLASGQVEQWLNLKMAGDQP